MAGPSREWNFVNLDTPDGVKDAAVKKQIRSHNAYVQHEASRKRLLRKGLPIGSSSSPVSESSPEATQPRRRRKKKPWTIYTPDHDTPASVVGTNQWQSMMATNLRRGVYNQLQSAPNESIPRLGDLINRTKVNSTILDAHFQNTVKVLQEFFAQSTRLQKGPYETSLAHSMTRENLRNAMVLSPSLFQTSLFVAGTYSNTCGMSYDQVHKRVGMLFMRGISLQAVDTALQSATEKETENGSSMAMALLAGWELKFGEKESYEIHLRAWQRMFQKEAGDDATNIPLMLSNVTFEAIREQLNNVAQSPFTPKPSLSPTTGLPDGFSVFATRKLEAMSLFSILREVLDYDFTTDDPPIKIRSLGLQAMAWTPHHVDSTVPLPTYEQAWDWTEMTALYHARGVVISIIALLAQHCHVMHRAVSYLDFLAGANVHAYSCQHLHTQELMGTRFSLLAIWARFTICAISPGSTPNELLKQWLIELNIETWVQMKVVLEAHLFLDILEAQAQTLFADIFP